MRDIARFLSILALMVFCFFIGYGVGISDQEPKETREIEKQIKAEELVKRKKKYILSSMKKEKK